MNIFFWGKQFHKPFLCTDDWDRERAQDGLRHSGERQMIDVFSLCGLGGSCMQNSKKERNPSSCPVLFPEGLPELATDRHGHGADPESRRGDSIISAQLDEPDVARPGCCNTSCSLWGRTQGNKRLLQQLNTRVKGEPPTPACHPPLRTVMKMTMSRQLQRIFFFYMSNCIFS